jgi:hypothetical protein
LKSFPYRDQATKAYQRAKPHTLAALRGILEITLEAILYVLDALKTLILRARQEPFIFLAAAATAAAPDFWTAG